MTNRFCIMLLAVLTVANVWAEDVKIASPDGKLQVTVSDHSGVPTYMVTYDGKTMMPASRLGLKASTGDFTTGISIKGNRQSLIDHQYMMTRIKTSQVHYVANEA